MDDIIEFIVEIILEALMAMLQSDKVPFAIRVIIYLLCSVFLWGLSIFTFMCAFKAESLWSLLLLLLGFVILWIWYRMSVNLYTNKKSEYKSSDVS